MKLCIDCKHFEKRKPPFWMTPNAYLAFCAHPERISPVDGTVFRECIEERRDLCGERGDLFETREESAS